MQNWELPHDRGLREGFAGSAYGHAQFLHPPTSALLGPWQPLPRTRHQQRLVRVPVHALDVAAVPRKHLLSLDLGKVPNLRC